MCLPREPAGAVAVAGNRPPEVSEGDSSRVLREGRALTRLSFLHTGRRASLCTCMVPGAAQVTSRSAVWRWSGWWWCRSTWASSAHQRVYRPNGSARSGPGCRSNRCRGTPPARSAAPPARAARSLGREFQRACHVDARPLRHRIGHAVTAAQPHGARQLGSQELQLLPPPGLRGRCRTSSPPRPSPRATA